MKSVLRCSLTKDFRIQRLRSWVIQFSNRVEVSSVHYTSAEEAWNNFKSEYFAGISGSCGRL